jgi:branched-chain amino acid aminotransferase
LIEAHPVVWVNGQRQRSDAVQVSARDRGFTLADGVFETMLAHNGVVFRLEAHLARLSAALRTLEIPEPAELRDWVDAAVSAGDLAHGIVRVTVTRGIAPGGLTPPHDPQPTVVVIVTPMPPPAPLVYERGLSGHIASGRRNEYAITSGLKTLSFTDGIAAMLEAQRAGADEALLLDTADHCSEGAASNLFAVLGGTVITPPLTCGVLPGITRAAVLELAAALGIPASERVLLHNELTAADEAFLTNSFRGIAPLVRVDGRPIASGVPGPVTRRLMAAYGGLIERECAG